MTKKLTLPIVVERDWPAPDRAAWRNVLRPGDPLDDPGPLADKTAEQISKLRAAYGRWLGFLAEQQIEWQANRGINHFTEVHVAGFVARLEAVLAPCSVRAYLSDLLKVAQAMAPDRCFDVLHGATRHICRTARPVADKRSRLVSARDLYDLGVTLMESADAQSTPLKAAGAFRDGLMIALLAARPVRRANLAAITIDWHLERRGDLYWLTFPAHEVKTRRTLEFPLPGALTAAVERYLAQYRPFLLSRHGRWKDDPGDAFWISGDGSRLKAKRLAERIRKRTADRFGQPVNPHLFRDAAATSIAIEDPEHVGIILAILGHSTIRTSETYYNQATGIEAARRYQGVIAAFR
jgi:integrase/recombinase XerD